LIEQRPHGDEQKTARDEDGMHGDIETGIARLWDRMGSILALLVHTTSPKLTP
jgi:hypothetical protein